MLVCGNELAKTLRKGQTASLADKDAAVVAGELAKAGAVVWGRMSDSGQELSF